MMGDGMMWGTGLWGIVLVVLAIAAPVNYFFFR